MADTVFTVIQAVRARDVEALRRQAARLGPVLVSYDDDWPADPNPWRGFRLAALRAMVLAATRSVLVLQDDAVLCRGFAEQVARLELPPEPLALYANRAEVGRALATGRSVVRIRRWLNSLAVLYPTPILPDLVEFGDRYQQQGGRVPYDDVRIAAYCDRRYGGMLCTAPCLVQHGAPTQSTVGNGGRQRRTRWFIDDVGVL